MVQDVGPIEYAEYQSSAPLGRVRRGQKAVFIYKAWLQTRQISTQNLYKVPHALSWKPESFRVLSGA